MHTLMFGGYVSAALAVFCLIMDRIQQRKS